MNDGFRWEPLVPDQFAKHFPEGDPNNQAQEESEMTRGRVFASVLVLHGTVVPLSAQKAWTPVNRPGEFRKSPATYNIFERLDGVRVIIAHLDSLRVKERDRVVAGQPVAVVSNNGMSSGPHSTLGRGMMTNLFRFVGIFGQRASSGKRSGERRIDSLPVFEP